MKRRRLLAVSLMIVLLGVLGCGLLPTSGGVPEMKFEAREDVIERGECTVLEWEVRGAEGYPAFLDGQEVDASGWEEVCPEETAGYKLVVGAPGGPYDERVTSQVGAGLGPGETVAVGDTRSWTIDAGRYDLKAEDSGQNVLHVQMDVNIVGTYHWYAE